VSGGVVAAIVLGAVLVVLVVGIPVASVIVHHRRVRVQRVVLSDGVLGIANGVTGRLKTIPVDEIGAVVYLPPRRTRVAEPPAGVWTWGGLLVLDTAGRVVLHAISFPDGRVSLGEWFERIPAPVHRQLGSYSRHAFLQEFPHALRFAQLWGAFRWTMTIVLLAIVLVPLIAFAIFFAVLEATA
jgi:hypothetical protein